MGAQPIYATTPSQFIDDQIAEAEDEYQNDTPKGNHNHAFFILICKAYKLYQGDKDKVREVAERNLNCSDTDNDDRERQIEPAIEWCKQYLNL